MYFSFVYDDERKGERHWDVELQVNKLRVIIIDKIYKMCLKFNTIPARDYQSCVPLQIKYRALVMCTIL